MWSGISSLAKQWDRNMEPGKRGKEGARESLENRPVWSWKEEGRSHLEPKVGGGGSWQREKWGVIVLFPFRKMKKF